MSRTGEVDELGEGTDTTELACEPGGDVSLSFSVIGAEPDPVDGTVALDLACTFVDAASQGPGGWLYSLDDCASLTGDAAPTSITLSVVSEPAVAPIIDPGAVLRLRYVHEPEFVDSFALTAQPGGLLVLAGHIGDDFGPGFEPLTVTASDRGCGPTENGCAETFAQRLRFEIVDASVELIAGEAAEFGDPVAYQAILGFAARYELFPGCLGPAGFSRYLVAIVPDA